MEVPMLLRRFFGSWLVAISWLGLGISGVSSFFIFQPDLKNLLIGLALYLLGQLFFLPRFLFPEEGSGAENLDRL